MYQFTSDGIDLNELRERLPKMNDAVGGFKSGLETILLCRSGGSRRVRHGVSAGERCWSRPVGSTYRIFGGACVGGRDALFVRKLKNTPAHRAVFRGREGPWRKKWSFIVSRVECSAAR
jgi:hypothetical protein